MNWYKEKKTEWKEIIEVVSREIKRTSIIIEKDVIQSMFLFELSKSEIPFTFKGGTSLSKAFGIINRFSEDIDLSLPLDPSGSVKRKSMNVIIETAIKLGLTLENGNDIKSRYDYNKYVFKYESVFTDIKPEIIIETSYYQKVYPVVKHKIYNFISIFCKKNNLALPIEFEGFEFEMNVQTMERTFVDKVFAVCDYSIQNMFERDSRHLYDIAKLLPNINVDGGLCELICQVRIDRRKSKNNPSAQPQYDINRLLEEIIRNRYFESDYNYLTIKLLFEPMSYDDAILHGISKVLELKLF